MTTTNQALRDQIEALKLQKELAQLQTEVPAPAAPQQEVCQPKAPHVAAAAAPRVNVDNGICERTDYAPGFKGNRNEINLARTRCYGIVAWHVVCPPIASVSYAAKTGKWGATVAATLTAAVGVPTALLDGGTTFFFAAPVVSVLLNIKQVTDGRKRLGITAPEQADAMKFASF